MKLKAYLERENLGFAAFGRLCVPPIPRVTIRQYALELRFPSSAKVFKAIQLASGGCVTANDFVAPVADARPKRRAA